MSAVRIVAKATQPTRGRAAIAEIRSVLLALPTKAVAVPSSAADATVLAGQAARPKKSRLHPPMPAMLTASQPSA